MSLLDVLRAGVKVADKVTKPFQPAVTYTRYVTSDAYGTETPPSSVSLRAIVELKKKRIMSESGVVQTTRAIVLFLDVEELLAATANRGIRPLDKIVLSDGSTGPILDVGGFIDAGTGIPVATEVFLG